MDIQCGFMPRDQNKWYNFNIKDGLDVGQSDDSGTLN